MIWPRFRWRCGPMNMVTSEFTATCSARDNPRFACYQKHPHNICIRSRVAACYRSRSEDKMRKLSLVLCITLIAAAQAASQTAPAPAAATTLTVIRAGSLIDGASDVARKNQLIFIRGERIEKVADASV